jgi:ribosomal protein S18 acetylase RimI-like enzyme
MKDFWLDSEKVKGEVMRGKEGRYWYLTSLATDPAYQGRGAGKMLLNWGIERADREGREFFLIGNAQIKGLYEKVGFVVVRKCGWDGAKWEAKEGWGIGL